mmetsp:Transcript_93056/g.139675  ORF Transcript_93056/g.139675 Transcript_93056/m.139675 type:complete len:96 (+) Transcript_93056:649-936(+)
MVAEQMLRYQERFFLRKPCNAPGDCSWSFFEVLSRLSFITAVSRQSRLGQVDPGGMSTPHSCHVYGRGRVLRGRMPQRGRNNRSHRKLLSMIATS